VRELFLYPLRDARWRWQLLLVSLLYTGLQAAFFPLALALEAGYALQAARNLLSGSGELEIPDGRDWKILLKDGARHWGGTIIYSLPGILLTGEVALAFALLSGQSAEVQLIKVALFILGLPLALLLLVFGAEMALLASMQVLIEDSFSAAFHFKAWWEILSDNFSEIQQTVLGITLGGGVLWLLALLALIPASLVCVGPFFVFSAAAVYLRLISVVAIAQIFRDGRLDLEEE